MPPDGHSYRHDLRHPRPAGRGAIVFRCPKPPGGPACFFPSNALTGPETQVTVRKPQALLLSLAVALALSACTGDKADNAAAADAADGANEAPALTLDESKLPPVNRFELAALDSSMHACIDFGGYVNGKRRAANAIPGDRTSRGAFAMLHERSIAVQRQDQHSVEEGSSVPVQVVHGVDRVIQ